MKHSYCVLILIPLLGGCGLMQSMMTRSVDPTAHAKILAVNGVHDATRMDPNGNSKQLKVASGNPLMTADLIIGSDNEANRLFLALDKDNHARFESADFVLRSPLGDDSNQFSVTVELGAVLFNITNGADKSFEVVDTNKNRVFVENTNAQFYLSVDDDGLRIFVKRGTLTVINLRSEKEYSLTPRRLRNTKSAALKRALFFASRAR